MIVNGMIDEMETLIHALAGLGSESRMTCERRSPGPACARARSHQRQHAGAAADGCGQTIDSLDQSLSIITAILRLAEIERSQRSAGFGKVALTDLVREVGDMYEPIAEDKGITLLIHSPQELSVHGDRDLLIEAVANSSTTPSSLRRPAGRLKSNSIATTARTSCA